MNSKKKISIVLSVTIICALVYAILELGYNYIYFIKTWFVLLISGIIFFPISMIIFKKNYNNGWMFSKLLGLLVPSLVLWNLSYLKIFKYSTFNCFLMIFLLLLISVFIFIKKKQYKLINKDKISSILVTELVFILALMIWMSVQSLNVAISSGTEQYMNYGFINKLMSTEYLPAEDIWLAGTPLNYYYFGQYFISFFGKVSFSKINELYNMAQTLISTFTFIMPFSIGYSLGKKIKVSEENKIKKFVPTILAIFIGLSITIGGTLHFPLYKYIIHDENNSYEYWDPVRYISDDTDTVATDVPAYSNLVGDVHAHYIDTMFTFTTIAMLVELLINIDVIENDNKNKKGLNYKRIFNLNILFLGIMLATQKMTNFWAFPIYIVVISVTLIINYLTKYKINFKSIIETILQIVLVMGIQWLVSFLFTKGLYISATSVKLTHKTSPFYKLLVLWGIPSICVLNLLGYIIFKFIKNIKKIKLKEYIENINKADVIALILGVCAIGLIIIPEIVYVKDIYGDNFKRFNTVFKLTYEAYILINIAADYIIIKYLFEDLSKCSLIIFTILFMLQCATLGYGLEGINYINSGTKYLLYESEGYLKENNPKDYKAIQWIKENIQKDKVILQAYGNSYSLDDSISVFTGNPTVLGWTSHEWTWRANKNYQPCDEQKERDEAVLAIYTRASTKEIKEYAEKYNISYIYIGEEENEKYNENSYYRLNLTNIKNAGEVVYQDNDVYLIKVKK